LPTHPLDTIALLSVRNSLNHETAWERSLDGSWTTMSSGWGVSLHLGIELRYVSEEAILDFDKVKVFGNENVLTFLYDGPENDAVMWTLDGQVVGESKNTFLNGLSPGRHTYTLYVRRGTCMHEIVGEFDIGTQVSGARTLETEKVVCHPNPNTGAFRIRGLSPGTKVEIFDMDGRRVWRRESFHEHEEIVRLCMPGAYIVRWNEGNNFGVQKVVVTP
ncbi:MAG: T9SS type A sorting domain-containing protein, partial [Bacteroidia bacterium]|nr:T9SS type A sorting domain-containing protein [Bacteroidia bacterium]